MAIEIILHGVKMTVTKDQLFELAANGGITKDTPVNVSGKMVAAKKIKGLVFGTEGIQQSPMPSIAVPHVASAPPVTNVVPYLERDSRSDIAVPSDRLIAHLFDGLYMLLLLCRTNNGV